MIAATVPLHSRDLHFAAEHKAKRLFVSRLKLTYPDYDWSFI
jgi:hypothetical protein